MKYLLMALLALTLSACVTTSVKTDLPTTVAHQSTTSAAVWNPPPIGDIFPTGVLLPTVPEVVLSDSSPPTISDEEIECLALNIYHEAGGEGDRGMIAVGYIVVNRMQSKKYPSTACGVIHQGAVAKNGRLIHGLCQFAWACDGKHHVPMKPLVAQHTRELARQVLLHQAPNPIGKSLYFHQVAVKMHLENQLTKYQIGHQVFFADVTSTRKRTAVR